VISHERPERTVAERDRAPNYDRPEWQAVRLVPETVAEPTAVRVSAQATETRSADVPSLPEFLATKLTSTDDNQQTLEVQLEPPELGRLVIKLVRSETGLKADFVVSNESARLAVQSELPALQRALEQAGITLNQFNVSQHGQDRSGGRPAQEERDVEPLVRRPNVSKTQAAAPPTMSRRAGSINLRV
jgi:hypothetical protein